MLIAIIVIALIVIVVLILIGVRNSMIGARNRVDESWSGIDVQLKRRHDLVPNLVESVKGYATHEQAVFEKTSQARSQAMAARDPGDAAKAEGQLTQALTDLRAVAENYPQLRATENFQKLMSNLSEIEDEIQAARRIYNSNVQTYNTKIQVFPNSVIANSSGFEAKEFFEIDNPADREPVSVSFDKYAALSLGHDRNEGSDSLDLRELRVHLRPGDRRSRRRDPPRNPVRGHPEGLVLSGLRRSHQRFSPARARRGLSPAWPAGQEHSPANRLSLR
jgi:LemA protein